MGNCLKVQLKESVSNSSLLKIGEIRASVTQDNSLYIRSTEPVTLKLLNGGNFIDRDFGEITTTFEELYVPQGETLSILKKYPITHLRLSPGLISNVVLDIKDLAFMPGILNLMVKMSGSLDDIPSGLHLSDFYISHSYVTGDISNFQKLPNLATLVIGDTPGITGNIVSLGSLYNLTTIQLGDCPSINGSIEEFVIAQRVGRESGTLAANYWGMTGITFNGAKISNQGTLPAATLEWTANTITFNGETINA